MIDRVIVAKQDTKSSVTALMRAMMMLLQGFLLGCSKVRISALAPYLDLSPIS